MLLSYFNLNAVKLSNKHRNILHMQTVLLSLQLKHPFVHPSRIVRDTLAHYWVMQTPWLMKVDRISPKTIFSRQGVGNSRL